MEAQAQVLENQLWYKIVEVDKDGNIKSLFHGTDGSRILKKNRWMTADVKTVRDGTNNSYYESGWHVIPSYRECKKYLEHFKILHNKKIAKCKVKVIWPKTHSRSNVWLSKKLIIKEIVNERRR